MDSEGQEPPNYRPADPRDAELARLREDFARIAKAIPEWAPASDHTLVDEVIRDVGLVRIIARIAREHGWDHPHGWTGETLQHWISTAVDERDQLRAEVASLQRDLDDGKVVTLEEKRAHDHYFHRADSAEGEALALKTALAERTAEVGVLRAALERLSAAEHLDDDDPELLAARWQTADALATSPPAALAKWRAVVEAAQARTKALDEMVNYSHGTVGWHDAKRRAERALRDVDTAARALADPAVAPLTRKE